MKNLIFVTCLMLIGCADDKCYTPELKYGNKVIISNPDSFYYKAEGVVIHNYKCEDWYIVKIGETQIGISSKDMEKK